jgi:hypothetical protein
MGSGKTEGAQHMKIAISELEHLREEIKNCHQIIKDLQMKREWVGLEPEEILDLFDRNNVYGSKWVEFARTVEAKLKEKNDH